MKIVRVLLLVSLALSSACSSRESGMGPLTAIIEPSSGGTWNVQTDGESVLMENRSDPGSVNYFYVNPGDGDEGRREVFLTLNVVQSQPNSLAGLIYGFQPNPKSYFLYTVGGDSSVSWNYVGQDGFREIMKFGISNLDPENIELGLQERGNEITLLVNGEEKSTFSNERTGRGSVGIVGVGIGSFQYSNFSIELSGSLASAESKAEPDRVEPETADVPRRGNVSFHNNVDKQNGMVQSRSPFPEGWQFAGENNNNLFIVGPNNIEVYSGNLGPYVYSDDQFAIQSARQAGGMIARPVSVEEFARTQHAEYLSRQGFSLVTAYPLPAVNDFYELVSAGMPQGLSRRNFYSLGVEWQRQDGTRVFTILVQSVFQRDVYTMWTVQYSDMYAPSADFDRAKADYLYAVEKTEMNPQWQIFKNKELLAALKRDAQKWRTRAAQSQAAHLGRMNAILARGASSSNIAKINSDILDISHAGYLNRSSLVSAGQAKSVDMIGEYSVIANNNTGERYRVEAGAKHYWVNNEGKYFTTDNPLVDPRTDNNISDQQWEKYDLVR